MLKEAGTKIKEWYFQLPKKERAAIGIFVGGLLLLLNTSCAESLPIAGQVEAADLNLNTKNNQPTAQVDPTRVSEDSMLRKAIELFGETGAEQSDRDLAVAATPTSTPTPRSTQEQPQPVQEQPPSPEAKVITAVVSAGSNLRSDHNITSAIVARLTSRENVVVIGKIDYPTGTFDWYKIRTSKGECFVREDLIKFDDLTITVPVLETLTAPTPAPAPTRKAPEKPPVVETTNIKYVTVPPGTFLFSSIGSGQIGETAGGPTEYKVIKESRGWFQIECPVDGKPTLLWILPTNMKVTNQVGTTNIIQPTNPGVVQNPNPETAPTSTGTHFGGIYTGHVWYIPEVELNLSEGGHNERVAWGPDTATITPVTGWVAEASEVTVYQNEGNLLFNVGAVDQNDDGSYSVLGNRLNSSYVVYIYIKDDAGNDTATNTKLPYHPSMVSAGERVGVNGNRLLLFVSLEKLPKIK